MKIFNLKQVFIKPRDHNIFSGKEFQNISNSDRIKVNNSIKTRISNFTVQIILSIYNVKFNISQEKF